MNLSSSSSSVDESQGLTLSLPRYSLKELLTELFVVLALGMLLIDQSYVVVFFTRRKRKRKEKQGEKKTEKIHIVCNFTSLENGQISAKDKHKPN